MSTRRCSRPPELDRLGLKPAGATILEPEEMLPAVAQGAIGVACRVDDMEIRALLSELDDDATSRCVRAERAMLASLDGSCRTPIAALARLDANELFLEGLVAAPDGRGLVPLRPTRAGRGRVRAWRRSRRRATGASAQGLDGEPVTSETADTRPGSSAGHPAAPAVRGNPRLLHRSGHRVLIDPLLAVQSMSFTLPEPDDMPRCS